MRPLLPSRRPAPRSIHGFSLLELLVVLAILALIAGIAGPQVMGMLGKAKSQTAAIQIKQIKGALEMYQLELGRYPSEEEGLAALIRPPAGASFWAGPYLDSEAALIDPWGQPYGYEFPAETAPFLITSLGADQAPGGTGEDADLSSAAR